MDSQENVITTEKPTALEIATKWYERWLKLPLILFISIVAVFFIWGIIDPCLFEYGRYDKYYGVMMLPSGFLCWFIWQLIGLSFAAIAYIGAKLVTAPIVLQTEYLKKISEKE